MIDWARVEELHSEVGCDAFKEVVELFLEEVSNAVKDLEATPSDNHLKERLHFLKGSALSLGFHDLAMLCKEGERRLENGESFEPAQIPLLYQKSKNHFLDSLKDRMSP